VTVLDRAAQRLLRDLAPQVLATILRRYRDFAGCDDAVQEALLAAATQWPAQGVPENPLGWLVRVATRRVSDQLRSETARRLREHLAVSLVPIDEQIALAADELAEPFDDTLLLFMCCHPALSMASRVALTLRAVGGLTAAEIARAYWVPESTMAQRLGRAKQTIQASGVAFAVPTEEERAERAAAVLKVLYLVFNEGYTASGGAEVHRVDLSDEAIRLTRLLARSLPRDAEVNGLLALMLLTDARRAARTGPYGELVPLDEQDRTRWNREAIAEGTALVEHALSLGAPGPYQVQAAIAALHDEASDTQSTDWAQILELYGVLLGFEDNPMARLSRAIAVSMVRGPEAGLEELDVVTRDARLDGHFRVHAVRGHLFERLGKADAASSEYRRAAGGTTSTAERDYLLLKASRVAAYSSA
jgi:RNA polymerase sigma factor (sigma-70 family)